MSLEYLDPGFELIVGQVPLVIHSVLTEFYNGQYAGRPAEGQRVELVILISQFTMPVRIQGCRVYTVFNIVSRLQECRVYRIVTRLHGIGCLHLLYKE